MKIKFEIKTVREPLDFCCDLMSKAEAGRVVVFPITPKLKTMIFGILPRTTGIHTTTPVPHEISYCPFCGEKIVFEEKI